MKKMLKDVYNLIEEIFARKTPQEKIMLYFNERGQKYDLILQKLIEIDQSFDNEE
jgi:hypothetical protein